jgi:hypothetical protein
MRGCSGGWCGSARRVTRCGRPAGLGDCAGAIAPEAKENQPPDGASVARAPLLKLLEPVLVIGEQAKSAVDYNSAQKTSSGHEVFCVRYSPDGQFVAAARGNGNIDVFSATKGTKVYELPSADQTGGSPTCCIRFRPNTASSKTRNVLLAVDAAGMVRGPPSPDKYDPPASAQAGAAMADPDACVAVRLRAGETLACDVDEVPAHNLGRS